MGRWKRIDTAPKDGRHLLIGSDLSGLVCEGYYEEYLDQGWFVANSHHTDAHDGSVTPTHWKPMPDPPAKR